jgi:hypothetical protein
VHVLLVTPVIFYWLRERQLRHEEGREGIATDISVATPPTYKSID